MTNWTNDQNQSEKRRKALTRVATVFSKLFEVQILQLHEGG